MPILGLLESDVLYPDLIDDYASYGSMVRKNLAALDKHLEFRHYRIQEGEFPSNLNECDAYLITGSKTGVYDNEPWLEPLAQWIKHAYTHKAKLLGICFGHQMLAHCLGGHASQSHKGWGVGNHMTNIKHLPIWLNDDSNAYQLIYSHKDQVESLPPKGKVLASSDFCEYAAWYIGDQVLSFQGHPEFTPEYFCRLLERRRDDVGSDLLDQALASIDQPNDSDKILRWMIEFIHI
jgi:GMP synthase-like glutamine amidotransferase